MRGWRQKFRTRGTCRATSCGAPVASLTQLPRSRPPTPSDPSTLWPKESPSTSTGTTINLDLLATSFQYIGQMTKAEKLLKAAFAIPSTLIVQEFNKREWPVFLRANGRFDEALAAAETLAAHPSPLVSATGHIEAGFACLAMKRYRRAADESNAALRLMRGAPQGAGLLADALQQLQG